MLLEDFKGNIILTFKEPLDGPYASMTDVMQGGHVDKSYVDKVGELIHMHSKQWIKEAGGEDNPFYRGLSSMTPDEAKNYAIISQPVRTNRTEKNAALHNYLIDLINKCSDGKAVANRHNSAFVSSNPLTARGYGIHYVALAIGDFHYTWHSKYRDLVALEDVVEQVDESDFCPKLVVDKGLHAAYDAQHEVMVHAKSMLLIHPALYELYREYR